MERFPESIGDALMLAEEVASKDLNNLFLTSRFFVDRTRYWAFCALYAVMRVVDDRIDEIPNRQLLDPEARRAEHAVVDAWQRALDALSASSGAAPDIDSLAEACDDPRAADLLRSAAAAMGLFEIPMELWDNFFLAMHRDLESAEFETYQAFTGYAEGASVAPTTIYLYLIASASGNGSDPYRPPAGFDIRACGHHLGLFAYLAHILRDLPKDLAAGDRGLLYLATDDLERYDLDLGSLHEDRQRKRARPELRLLLRDLAERSEGHLRQGQRLMEGVHRHLQPDCSFILTLIVAIYEKVLEKIADHSFDPMAGGHMLTLQEKQQIIADTATRVGYAPG
ncbi:MAG: squalene/phytoene synthase family protein [Holophagales bacterium]|nr:squalene/phytoene synthase family protein [Holophagales bacterium]